MNEIPQAEWDSQVDQLMERSAGKIKNLSKEKEELELNQIKLLKERASLEKDKSELRVFVSKLSDEINQQNRGKFELQSQNQKLSEELFLLNEKLERSSKELSIKETNFSQDIAGSSLKNSQNQEFRNQEITKMIELHEKMLNEKMSLEDDLANKNKLISALTNEINEHNNLERKRIDKTKEFVSVVDTLYDMSIREKKGVSPYSKVDSKNITPNKGNIKSPSQVLKSSGKKK